MLPTGIVMGGVRGGGARSRRSCRRSAAQDHNKIGSSLSLMRGKREEVMPQVNWTNSSGYYVTSAGRSPNAKCLLLGEITWTLCFMSSEDYWQWCFCAILPWRLEHKGRVVMLCPPITSVTGYYLTRMNNHNHLCDSNDLCVRVKK